MTKPVEFSEVYKLLYSIKEGDDTKIDSLALILKSYSAGEEADSFLLELGQSFIAVGLEELYKYTSTSDLREIGNLTSQDWENLAEKNNGEIPPRLANTMISYSRNNQLPKKLSSKWEIPRREVEKHVMQMARYITEGLLDSLE